MSGVQVGKKPRHPEGKKLSEAVAEDKDAIKARKGLIDKTATLVKAADDESDAFGDLGGTMTPTDEQLAAINGYTRKTVTADEVVAFTTLSCNDIIDRDDDQFTTQCVKDFAELPQPFSPTGKSFMLDHAYSVGNAVGRIFGTDTKKVSGATFLTNEIYMPKTEQFQPLIEKIDFGISWAVSVGVMLGKDECSVCKSPFSYYGYWCQEGHDKGYFYDPKSDETDSWGYPVPCDPDTKGAVKCVRKFSEPRDMYELSQVFLGAQYFAALEKEPAYASVMKGFKPDELPVIGLSKSEADELPIKHEPKKVSEARRAGLLHEDAEDGSYFWTEPDSGLRWMFDPAQPEQGVLSLGKEATHEGEDDGEHEVPGGPGSAVGDEGHEADASVADAGAGDGGSGVRSDPADPSGELERGVPSPSVAAEADPDDDGEEEEEGDDDEGSDPSSSDDDDEDEVESEGSDEEKAVKKRLLALASEVKLPQSVIDAAKAQKGDGLSALLLAASAQIESLTPKAALGEQLLRELRSDAIDWYTKARQTRDNPGVSTEKFEKVLDKCADDVEMLRYHIEEQKELAQAKFPAAVRRSSFPTDPNVAQPPAKVSLPDDDEVKEGGDETGKRATRIHG